MNTPPAPTGEKPTDKTAIFSALRAWIKQRPGLDYGNYASGYNDAAGRRAYFKELREITRDLRDAKALLAAVGFEGGITGDDLLAAFSAFSGRLSWDGERLEYVTGQYWPTEYRAAVCAVAARALWEHRRKHGGDADAHGMRRHFRERFGRWIQTRWLD